MQTVKKSHRSITQCAPYKTHSQQFLQTQYQIQKKPKNLFYIKSKHTKKYFKNHPYFNAKTQPNITETNFNYQKEGQSQRSKQKLINVNNLRIQTKMLPQKEANQFVALPTHFGLENTYKFLHDQSFLSREQNFEMKKRKIKFNKSFSVGERIRSKNQSEQNSKIKTYMKNTAAYESRLYSTIYPNYEPRHQVKQRSFRNHTQHSPEIPRKKQPTFHIISRRHSLNLKDSIFDVAKSIVENSTTVSVQNKIYNTPVTLPVSKLIQSHHPAKHQIIFLYGKRIKSFAELQYREISFDVLPLLINTFLKCKVHYKEMTQGQYNFIRDSMVNVLQSKKKPQKYDIKDIINLSSVKDVIGFVSQFKTNDTEWVETIRYFFVTNEEKVLEYYLHKIKEEVAKLISIKYDVQFGQKPVILWDIEKQVKVESFYDVIQAKRLLIGDQVNTFINYEQILNDQVDKRFFQSKIKKWKSIALCQNIKSSENGQINKAEIKQPSQQIPRYSSKDKLIRLSQKSGISQQKFTRLFEQFKIRQKKRYSKRGSIDQNSVALKCSPQEFIERMKLRRQQDIFQN